MNQATIDRLLKRKSFTKAQRKLLVRAANVTQLRLTNILETLRVALEDELHAMDEDDNVRYTEARYSRIDNVVYKLEDSVENLDAVYVPETKEVL